MLVPVNSNASKTDLNLRDNPVFIKYLMEHPEVSQEIPKNALLVFQLEGSNESNK